MVEICTWYEGGIMIRRTANGINIPVDNPNLSIVSLPYKEFKKKYGKYGMTEKNKKNI